MSQSEQALNKLSWWYCENKLKTVYEHVVSCFYKLPQTVSKVIMKSISTNKPIQIGHKCLTKRFTFS